MQRSKTDQLGRGEWVTLSAGSDISVCLVAVVGSFLAAHPCASPLTTYQFSNVLNRCLGKLGLRNLRFSSHSFRIGAASDAAVKVMPAAAIMGIGRWKSKCCRKYIRPNLATVIT